MVDNLSIFIPTFMEEHHIQRSVSSALKVTSKVYVIDSYSTDKTVEIAESLGAKVFYYKWLPDSNWAKKFNWTLENVPFDTDWVMRLDADEYFTDSLLEKMKDLNSVSKDVNAISINRREYFMRRWMKHGGAYPKTMIRIFRLGKAHFETRLIDEHVEVRDGSILNWNYDICDDKIITLTKWCANHNIHSIKEAMMLIHNEIGLFDDESDSDKKLEQHAMRKRQKKNFYGKLPLFWRAWGFFAYRYIFKLGFLDGVEGFLYCFLQCLWYRNLADAKMMEAYRTCGKDREKLRKYFVDEYGIDCGSIKKI